MKIQWSVAIGAVAMGAGSAGRFTGAVQSIGQGLRHRIDARSMRLEAA